MSSDDMLYEWQKIVQNTTGVLNKKNLKKLREINFSIKRRDTIISYDTILVIELVLPQNTISITQEKKERTYEKNLKEYNKLCSSKNGRAVEEVINRALSSEKKTQEYKEKYKKAVRTDKNFWIKISVLRTWLQKQ
jgi:uncharacterized protein YbcV (DUF1398 family)